MAGDNKFKLRSHQLATEYSRDAHEACSQQTERSWFWHGAEGRCAHRNVPDTCDQLSIVGIEVLGRRSSHANPVVECACDGAGKSEGKFRSSFAVQSPINRAHEAAGEKRRLALGRARQTCQPCTLPNYGKGAATVECSATRDRAGGESAGGKAERAERASLCRRLRLYRPHVKLVSSNPFEVIVDEPIVPNPPLGSVIAMVPVWLVVTIVSAHASHRQRQRKQS